MDALKETLDAWLARVKSPVLGYIVLAFILVNWKPLWFLVFADYGAYHKIHFFDQHTDWLTLYVKPVVIGVAAAAISPWAELFGAWLARLPLRKRKQIQDDHETDLKIANLKNIARLNAAEDESQAKIEAARETALLARAERDVEAAEIGPEATEALKTSRSSQNSKSNPIADSLSDVEKLLLVKIGSSNDSLTYGGGLSYDSSGKVKQEVKEIMGYQTRQQTEINISAAFSRIKDFKLATVDGYNWKLTKSGFDLYDTLKGYQT